MDPTAIALLIDADNCPAAKITVILDELSKFGVVNIRRAYGDWKASALGGWADILHDYAIQPVQQFAYTKGKNATDSAIIIDAMDLLYTQKLSAFGIASSDSDFTPLAMRLRANKLKVFGFGEAKTPPSLSSMRARSFSSSKTLVLRCKLRAGAPKRHKPCQRRNRPMNCAGTRAWLPTSAAPSKQFPMKRVGRRSVASDRTSTRTGRHSIHEILAMPNSATWSLPANCSSCAGIATTTCNCGQTERMARNRVRRIRLYHEHQRRIQGQEGPGQALECDGLFV